jgi:hypothetical protein
VCTTQDRDTAAGRLTNSSHSGIISSQLFLFVTGVVAGAISTLVVERPKKAATKVRQAAEFVMKKVRERYEAGESPNDQPAEGPGKMAA